MKIIRVFPRRTKATPDDALAVVDRLPMLWDEADAVHVSVTFDADLAKAERLAKAWRVVAPVETGGPALRTCPGDFRPGVYLKHGYTITSRGCPNRCNHCRVPDVEGRLRLLSICDGFDVLDNNILACPRDHIEAVFAMLARQKQRARFTGGLEAARLKSWHVDALLRLKPETLWMAYDSPDDWEPLHVAVQLLTAAGIVGPHKKKRTGAYVLIGRHGDTPQLAKMRLDSVIRLGIKTQAMLFDNGSECRWEDMKDWYALRRHYTDARSVGKMVSESWGAS